MQVGGSQRGMGVGMTNTGLFQTILGTLCSPLSWEPLERGRTVTI